MKATPKSTTRKSTRPQSTTPQSTTPPSNTKTTSKSTIKTTQKPLLQSVSTPSTSRSLLSTGVGKKFLLQQISYLNSNNIKIESIIAIMVPQQLHLKYTTKCVWTCIGYACVVPLELVYGRSLNYCHYTNWTNKADLIIKTDVLVNLSNYQKQCTTV